MKQLLHTLYDRVWRFVCTGFTQNRQQTCSTKLFVLIFHELSCFYHEEVVSPAFFFLSSSFSVDLRIISHTPTFCEPSTVSYDPEEPFMAILLLSLLRFAPGLNTSCQALGFDPSWLLRDSVCCVGTSDRRWMGTWPCSASAALDMVCMGRNG